MKSKDPTPEEIEYMKAKIRAENEAIGKGRESHQGRPIDLRPVRIHTSVNTSED